MVWVGLLFLAAGAVAILALHGAAATWAGAAALALGALLLIAGILRLRRARRAGSHTGGREAVPYRTSKGKIAAMVIAVLYIVSPIDVIPDFLLPVGIVDDATALTWLLFALGQEYTRRARTPRHP
ncbi:YkvA family protein [Actinomadura atramentaria]|uniref:YkvA family protein n=1 Tax=Actinomadura atramentaria TaxID=1990 RepID=UPI00036B86E3|nr:YkvA family protein [Actinomadura atramentaria]